MANLKALKGCGTALVTPFQSDGNVDEAALKKFVEFQIGQGIDFLVPCGSTGESVTLTVEEHRRVVELVVDQAAGRAPVLAGAGGNNTRHVIELAKGCEEVGADGILSVSPAYNKPTPSGLVQHYRTIAEATTLPIIVYNVPGRTGSNIDPDTLARLAEIDTIIGVKEASGNITQIGDILTTLPSHFKVFSGDDALTVPVIALGGVGVISVASNEAPAEMTRLTRLCLEGRFEEAGPLNQQLWPLMKINFIESNPIPVKAALAMMGYVEESYRLPLTPMKPENKEKLKSVLAQLGVVQSAAHR
jgi:4-hydroxy-tetrahydrodipicolinate synthase